MPNIDRTAAGMQMVLPGCERRTLPKSTTHSDETGHGLLQFFSILSGGSLPRFRLGAVSRAPYAVAGKRRRSRWAYSMS